MLNLNLNTNLTTTTITGGGRGGFFPYVTPDPYSASLVVAVPGQIFYNPNDRSPLFGAGTNPYYDASPSIRGTGAQIALTATGSNSSSIVSVNGSPWGTDYGYNSSMFVPTKAAINAGTGSAFRILSSSNWVVESWVAFPTASTATNPNHFLLNKVIDAGSNNAGNSYSVPIVSFNKVVNPNDGNFPTNTGPYPVSGGLAVQIFNNDILSNYGYTTLWPQAAVSESFLQNGFYHFAVSMTVESGSGAPYATYRGFVNGNEIMEQFINPVPPSTPPPLSQANAGTNTPMLLMGNLLDLVNLQLNPIGTPDTIVSQSAAIFQDFRFYNGTNKNYTASFDVSTTVKPIVIGNAY